MIKFLLYQVQNYMKVLSARELMQSLVNNCFKTVLNTQKYEKFHGNRSMSSSRTEQIDKLNFHIFNKQVQPFLIRHYTEHTRLLLG